MIVGLLPLMFASGVGRNGNQTLGAAAVGGMLIGYTLSGLCCPCSVLQASNIYRSVLSLLYLKMRRTRIVAKELAQFAKGPATDYVIEE